MSQGPFVAGKEATEGSLCMFRDDVSVGRAGLDSFFLSCPTAAIQLLHDQSRSEKPLFPKTDGVIGRNVHICALRLPRMRQVHNLMPPV